MKQITRKWKALFGALLCLALTAVSLPATVKAGEALPVSEPLYIMGTIHREGDAVLLTNVYGESAVDELILNISEETRILDAVNGFPVSVDALREGEVVYAYISQAMALSLPPQSHASVIICQIPADFTAPRYETIKSFTQTSDGNYQLSTVHGNIYTVSGNTVLLPYLTRNIVTLSDLTAGRSCLVWGTAPFTSESAQVDAVKIVLFPGGSSENGTSGPAGDLSLARTSLR